MPMVFLRCLLAWETQNNAVPSPCDSSLHASRAYRIPTAAALEAVVMGKPRVKPNYRRRVLRLPDLDHCKTAVLNSLGSPASRRVYEYAIDQFIAWYCSEPRLAFNRIVVVRYRMYLESRHLAANTINQQLAAVRRLAHEAADAGLLSPELAAGQTTPHRGSRLRGTTLVRGRSPHARRRSHIRR